MYIYIENCMEIFFSLFFYRLDDFRMGIYDIQDANTADPVKEFISVHIFKHGS